MPSVRGRTASGPPDPPTRSADGADEPGPGATAGAAGSGGEHRAGFCALVGLPNVGKTTLLNRLVGRDLGVVTPKAQTTRRRLRGIFSDERGQAVFVDTPGRLEPSNLLQHSMQWEADQAREGADLVVYVADAGYGPSLEAARELAGHAAPSDVLCLNKMDRVEEEDGERLASELAGAGWEAVIPVVAVRGQGVEELRSAVLERLPPSPPLYPPDQISTAPLRFFAAEFVREACFRQLAQEVPYAVGIEVESFREGEEPVYIGALIHVERSSQKGIVIGEGGRRIRGIGIEARERLEDFLGERVYLDLRVKVLPKWRKRRDRLARLGYRLPDGKGRR